MKKPELPANETARLLKLAEYQVLDTAPEPAFDGLTALAAHVTSTPMAVISLMDGHRQWFKSRHGVTVAEVPRDVSFCAHVVATELPLVVPDTLKDERFADNPMVTGEPHVRFYAGAPLRTPDGFVLGTLCVMDREPRDLSAHQRDLLRVLAHQVVDQLEMRRQGLMLRSRQHALQNDLRETSDIASRLQSILESANLGIIETTPDGTIREFNPAAERMLGYSAEEMIGRATPAVFHDPSEVVARAKELSAELNRSIEGFDALVARARAGGADEREWTHIRKDGSRFAVHLSITARRDPLGQIAGFMAILSDISARRVSEEDLRQHMALLKLGAEVARAFTANAPLPRMLQSAVEAVVTNLGAAFARIWTLDETGKVLELRASAGQYTRLDGKHARAPVGQFMIGMVAAERQPHLTNAVSEDPLIEDQLWARKEGLVSFAGYPLLVGDRLVGVLAMFARRPLPPAVLETLGVVATNAAVWIDRTGSRQA